MQALEAEIDRLKSVIKSGGTFHSPMPSERASCDPEKDKEIKSNPPSARGVVLVYEDDDCVFTDGPPRPSPPGSHAQHSCELYIERLENKVAFGMVYPREDNLTNLVHGVDIPTGHQCVSVDGLIKPDALLPVEMRGDDMMTFRDALGSFLAWPEKLINYTNIAEISEIPELAETFVFIDPGSTYHVNANFEAYILNRLTEGNPDRLFFLPHNQNMHWILVVIWEGEIYILNPLPHLTQFSELRKALSRALKSYNSEIGRGNKMAKAKFLSVGSPKQPNGIECAYVIMRYLKEIIDDDKLNFPKKWLAKTQSCYSIEQLDEVCIEALQFIQEHI
ncbi:uncharacterized protein LOC141665029 [Apium graveolens]|uniref:uncharacterized protein LOC141665029 n=1 Tax=Apium graveolens TaxID=4045 RepID=UPI003D7AEC05